jgi:serine phosphatase RsbU (regulator of sigma subunit)
MQKLGQAQNVAKKKVNELATLNRFAKAIGSTLDLQEILQIICKEMVKIFKARNTGIGLLNRKKTLLKVVAFHTTRQDEVDSIGIKIPLAENAATHYVLETGQPIVIPDAQNNPLTASAHDIFRGRGTQCIMIVPLLTKGEVIGTIGIPTSEKDRVFTDEEVALAQTIAGQIVSAIENARLYKKTEKAREIAERDLEIGRQIQAGFFPEKLPSPTGWEIAAYFQPARQVAGDFYDVFTLGNDGHLCLVIADVCDKGVGAALFMALFRSLIRAFAKEKYIAHFSLQASGLLPAVVMQQTIIQANNYIAITHGRTNMFATLFLGIVDTKSGLLDFINGGHEPPFVIGSSGVQANLQPTGPAVGLFPDMEFKTKQIRLSPGETFIGFTDGVTDSQNKSGERFTKKRLMETASKVLPSAKSLLGHICTEVNQHISDSETNDDMTILVIRRN